MCGIVGYTGSRSCRGLLLEGLSHLEYRGYDSAGLSLVGPGGVESVHAVGKLSFLQEAVAAGDDRDNGTMTLTVPATTGIAHTRWWAPAGRRRWWWSAATATSSSALPSPRSWPSAGACSSSRPLRSSP